LLAHAPATDAAEAYREAASRMTVSSGSAEDVASRFRSAVIPERT